MFPERGITFGCSEPRQSQGTPTMRIVNSDPQLIKDIMDEIKVIAIKEQPSLTVHAGRHPVLGKVVVIQGINDESVIVEVDE